MGNFFSLFLQIILCTVAPFLVLGLAVWFLRQVFAQLVGTNSGRPFLLGSFALSTPLREAGHVAMAVLFWHRVEEVRFLDLNALDGEMGYTEHSYHPRNPIALLGNFFFALGPVLLGLAAVLVIFLACFGGVMEQFFAELSALSGTGTIADYLRVGVGLIPKMVFSKEVGAFPKILGGLLLLLVCMGVFVSLGELLDGLFGAAIYAGLSLAVALLLALLDERAQRVATDALRAFATGVLALYLPVLLAVCALLIVGAIFFLVRKLGAVPETGNAVQLYRGDDR
jgi:hypothetical protein